MKVIKFGGSSLADAVQIKKVCNIVLDDSTRRLVVVSAPGKRFANDKKVTDMLIELANEYIKTSVGGEPLAAVINRYAVIAEDLNLGNEIIVEIENDLKGRLASKGNHVDKFMDLMKAAGEDNCAKLVAAYLQSIGVNAEYINPKDAGLLLSDEFGNARVLPKAYEELAKLAEKESIMIFPGFFGYSENGEVVTFSRGGSDVTGAVLASAVNAEVYENFTDVDSVYAANPNIIKDPCPIPVFTYEEMRELSYAGFSILHEETLEPVFRKGIRVNIKNTNNPSAPGTFIVPDNKVSTTPIVGIAADKGFMTIHVQKYLMNREIGFGRKLLQIIEDEGLSYEHTPSGIDSISIILREKECNSAKLDIIVGKIHKCLHSDKVVIEKNQAIVMIVGQGMSKNVGIAGRATTALSKSGINIKMINQGSSEVSIMFGVSADDADKSVRALYDEFFGG